MDIICLHLIGIGLRYLPKIGGDQASPNVPIHVGAPLTELLNLFFCPQKIPQLTKGGEMVFLYESIEKWPLRNFFTFHHLVDSYRNTISEWAVAFRYGNFFIPWVEKTLKLARGKEKLTSRGPTALGKKAFLPVG